MSSSFPDSSKAEECFHKLNLVKENSIFTTLAQLLDDVTIKSAQATRDHFLRKIGERHPHFGFLRLLSTRCLFNIFSSEHVHCILDHFSHDEFGNNNMKDSSVKLLLAIVNAFPSILRGSENQLRSLLLEDSIPFNEDLLQMLAKAGPLTDIKLSDIYPALERVCLEGTRAQSKLAVSAIASLISTSEQYIFPELCETLVDALHGGQNIPTVLQSLGCIAQHSVSTFESQYEEIRQYVVEKFFQSSDVELSNSQDSFEENSGNGVSCKWKIFGLKALVKSFLPLRPTHIRRDISHLLDVLSQMLKNGYVSNGIASRESDTANIRLAAAKSVLRLSRRWDLHIPPHVFHFTILMAKDSSDFARKLFVDKIHKLLKQHAVPSKYACAFAVAASDSPKDLQDDSLKYMAEFIREFNGDARIHQTSSNQLESTDYPAYIVVFLIHVLAHDLGFPAENCDDEEIYVQFLSPLVFTLKALLNATFVNGDMDVVNTAVSCLRSIFFAIKRTEDAVDAHATPKLHFLADFGISILNALNNSASTSHTLGSVLLPSSLYKNIPAGKREEVNLNCLARCRISAKIAKKVVPSFKSQISCLSSTLNRGRKSGEHVTEPDVKCSTSNLALCKNDDLFVNGIKEQSESSFSLGKEINDTMNWETNIKRREKRALSPSFPGSVELLNKFSIHYEHEKGASGNSEPLTGREQLLSSCDSVTTKPSLTQKDDLKSSSLTVNGMVKKSDSAKPSKLTRVAGLCSIKVVGNKSQAIDGQRIKLWSPVDKCFCSGTVSGFDSRNDTHKITYDNGEVDVVNLETETWDTISNDFLQEKESNIFDSQQCDFVHFQTEMDGAFRDICQAKKLPSKRKKNILKRRISLSGKENKGQVSADTSTSEVVDVNEEAIPRRTRRRK